MCLSDRVWHRVDAFREVRITEQACYGSRSFSFCNRFSWLKMTV